MKDDWRSLGIHFKDVAQGRRGAVALKEITSLVEAMNVCKKSMRDFGDFALDVSEIIGEYKNEWVFYKR